MVETSVIPENHLTHDTDRVPMYLKTQQPERKKVLVFQYYSTRILIFSGVIH